jgi:hypothetical protein
MPANPNSILDTVKKALGFDPEFEAFDLDITLFTNAAFGYLRQLGVGSDTGFIISDNTTLWSQYITSLEYLNMVKTYIIMFVKLAFDPPATSFGIDAVKGQIDQLGWRINIVAEELNPPSDPFDSDTSSIVTQGGVMTTFFAPKVIRLTFASTVTPDASEGNVFYLELTADCTINSPGAGSDGEHITLEVTSNGFDVTWGNGWNFGNAGTPVLSADKTDIVSAYYRTDVTDWRAGFTPGF